MLAEQNSKAGCMCQPAIEGTIRCPLMVRSTSEDVVTSNLFGTLKQIQPRWWLPHLLNIGLHLPRDHRRAFRTQVWRNFSIDLWQKQSKYPPSMIPWKEGITEVDVVIEWENPPTTVFVEMKYGSPLSKSTNRNDGDMGYPADQLIRNIRVGLLRTGWISEPRLFQTARRDFLVMVVSPHQQSPSLVREYSSPHGIRQAIPNCSSSTEIPLSPMVGYASYTDIANVLAKNAKMMSRAEKTASSQLIDYLRFKTQTLPVARHQSESVQPLLVCD